MSSTASESEASTSPSPQPLTKLPFPPVTKSHILHCAYAFWHPLYRSHTPKARILNLTPPFLEYLREDSIVLPDDDENPTPAWSDQDSGIFSQSRSSSNGSAHPDSDDDGDVFLDPSQYFLELHSLVRATIAELGGSVTPKLNWSAPKDATWISATNSMECRTPSDVYLLLKSSDFITHDLEHAFDDCDDDDDEPILNNPNLSEGLPEPSPAQPQTPPEPPSIQYTLILRKLIPQLNPALEFRCFVRSRTLLALSQRDLNHFAFLFPMRSALRARIQAFFDTVLRDSFPDPNFVFDVYVPPPFKRVWLVDVNPWAGRTDPLLFSWLEVLEMETDRGRRSLDEGEEEEDDDDAGEETDADEDGDVDELPFVPELRLVKKDDPEAYGFNTPQYSAHKLPKDVVDASAEGPGPMREFADKWKEMIALQQQQQGGGTSG